MEKQEQPMELAVGFQGKIMHNLKHTFACFPIPAVCCHGAVFTPCELRRTDGNAITTAHAKSFLGSDCACVLSGGG